MNTTEIIRALNDQLRRTLSGGRVVLTLGVQAAGEEAIIRLLALVQSYDNFVLDNDPFEEHDFGIIVCGGQKYFWKIDYYDLSYTRHSPDAADASITRRVLTVMNAEEY